MHIGLVSRTTIAERVLFQRAKLQAERNLLLLRQRLIAEHQQMPRNKCGIDCIPRGVIQWITKIKARDLSAKWAIERRDSESGGGGCIGQCGGSCCLASLSRYNPHVARVLADADSPMTG